MSLSVISEVNWFNWDSSFKKTESSLSVTVSFATVKEMLSVGFEFSFSGRFEIDSSGGVNSFFHRSNWKSFSQVL